jgi:hypothetical protein
MSPVCSFIKFLPELLWDVSVPYASKHTENTKLRFVMQEGLKGSKLTTIFVRDPIQSMSRPYEGVTLE